MRSGKPSKNRKNWNEANTFSKLIIPDLENRLGYPSRESRYLDEQTWVRRQSSNAGPYDAAYLDEHGAVILLVEAKKEAKALRDADFQQAFTYALGGSFSPLPPPLILVSSGTENIWFRRIRNEDDVFSYTRCDEIPWRIALQEKAASRFREELSIRETISAFKEVRKAVFSDLKANYFPNGFGLQKSALGRRRIAFEKIINTRKSFVDSTLSKKKEPEVVEAVLSSIALSITLKILFVKVLVDLRAQELPLSIRKFIDQVASDFPGILKAEPYDVLDFSEVCEEVIFALLENTLITKAIVFSDGNNPIGDIWDGLVASEEEDLQVESLGNVYTPPPIVETMVTAAESSLGSWAEKKILEPSCGSGHFVRELYKRIVIANTPKKCGGFEHLAKAHKAALENLRAIDIDPFAVQTTQLGMFIELYRIPPLWNKLAPEGRFDFSKIVRPQDFLDDRPLFDFLSGFDPDLIIGNPPYGVTVNGTTTKRLGLQNNDSYGCFIIQALKRLTPNGKLFFVVSSTFLTNRTHKQLRSRMFELSDVSRVLILHRGAFPGRDVFTCIFEAKTSCKPNFEERDDIYKFADAWSVPPTEPFYREILKSWAENKPSNLPESKFMQYEMPETLLGIRLMPPHPKKVEEAIRDRLFSAPRSLLKTEDRVFPIVGGSPTLFLLCADTTYGNQIREIEGTFPEVGQVSGLEIRRPTGNVTTVKLWQIADVKVGLQTSDDKKFVFKTPGVIPNARRKFIRDADVNCLVSLDDLANLSDSDKKFGIPVLDRRREKFLVPFDKGGEQDPAGGELRSFWSPVDYWIDWSRSSVRCLEKRAEQKEGGKRPVFRNRGDYFKNGIRFSTTGLYAPSFEVSFGGVFSHTGSLILPFQEKIRNYLLAVLTSPTIRYLTKAFLQQSIHTEADIVRQIPIPVPPTEIFGEISMRVQRIIEIKKEGEKASAEIQGVWAIVDDLFSISADDKKEIDQWFKRKYPNFGRKISSD